MGPGEQGRGRGTDVGTMLAALAIAAGGSFASDPGASCLLLVSTTLWRAPVLACGTVSSVLTALDMSKRLKLGRKRNEIVFTAACK